jgi:hypothetical protein
MRGFPRHPTAAELEAFSHPIGREVPLTVGSAMPVACRDREKALPDARWCARIRRAQGGAQRQLQAWPLHRRHDRNSPVAEGEDSRGKGID